jgi:hypothetical protein
MKNNDGTSSQNPSTPDKKYHGFVDTPAQNRISTIFNYLFAIMPIIQSLRRILEESPEVNEQTESEEPNSVRLDWVLPIGWTWDICCFRP